MFLLRSDRCCLGFDCARGNRDGYCASR
ncbi:unnamed protein product, partial [Rotaria sp. Silwood2]